MVLALLGPVVVILLSIKLKLKIESKLLVSLVRSITQLLLAGNIIFSYRYGTISIKTIIIILRIFFVENDIFLAQSGVGGTIFVYDAADSCPGSNSASSSHLQWPLLRFSDGCAGGRSISGSIRLYRRF